VDAWLIVKGANLEAEDRGAAVRKVALGVQVEEDRRAVPAAAKVAVARKAAVVEAVVEAAAQVVRAAAPAAAAVVAARREAPVGLVAAVKGQVDEVEVRRVEAAVVVEVGEAVVVGRVGQEVVGARKVARVAAVGAEGKEAVRDGLEL
jgi:hypothetical protein